jgi:hypothetical protein
MELSKILRIPDDYRKLKERERYAMAVRECLHDSRVGKFDMTGDKKDDDLNEPPDKPGTGKPKHTSFCLTRDVKA